MANDDKLENKIDQGTGKLKEAAGKTTGDDSLAAEGQGQATKAGVKDNLQDAASTVKDAFKR